MKLDSYKNISEEECYEFCCKYRLGRKVFRDIKKGKIDLETISAAVSQRLLVGRSTVEAAVFFGLSYEKLKFFRKLSHQGSDIKTTYRSRGEDGIDVFEVHRSFVEYCLTKHIEVDIGKETFYEFVRDNVGGVYAIDNLWNGKRYVGQSKAIVKRVRQELSHLNNGITGVNPKLGEDYIIQGREGFKLEVIEIIYPFDEDKAKRAEKINIRNVELDNLYNHQHKKWGRVRVVGGRLKSQKKALYDYLL